MIKNLIETFNLIRDDPYLNRILNNPRYHLTTATFIADSRIRIIPGDFAGVFPEAININFTEGNKKLIISLTYDSYTCKITEETFNRLIDPELFIECVNTLFEYKDFFRSEGIAGMPGKAAVLWLGNTEDPCVVYEGQVSRQSVDAQLFCDNDFSLWCVKRPGSEPHFGITNHDAEELSAGSSIVTTCDESDFIDKFKTFLKPLEIEPFIAKHKRDAKEVLDKFLDVIESNIG